MVMHVCIYHVHAACFDENNPSGHAYRTACSFMRFFVTVCWFCISNKFRNYFHSRSVTDFYEPRLERRLNAFNKDLEEMEVYSTELRKLEKCLRTLKSEPKDEKTVMALRNYNAVLKSLANLKTKIMEYKVSECN